VSQYKFKGLNAKYLVIFNFFYRIFYRADKIIITDRQRLNRKNLSIISKYRIIGTE